MLVLPKLPDCGCRGCAAVLWSLITLCWVLAIFFFLSYQQDHCRRIEQGCFYSSSNDGIKASSLSISTAQGWTVEVQGYAQKFWNGILQKGEKCILNMNWENDAMSLSRGVMCQIMCQIITFKRHQTFLHHPAPREKEHLAFPTPSSSAFVHITLNGVGGGGKVERGKLRPNCMCKSPMVCVSLSRTPGCVPLETLPLLTVTQWAVPPPAQSQEKRTSRKEKATTEKPEWACRGNTSFCILQLLHKPSFPTTLPHKVNSDKSGTRGF